MNCRLKDGIERVQSVVCGAGLWWLDQGSPSAGAEAAPQTGLLGSWRESLQNQLPAALTSPYFGEPLWKWLGLLLLSALAVIADRVTRFFVVRGALRVAKLLRLHLNRETLLTFERPMGLLAGALAFDIMLPLLGLEDSAERVIGIALSFLVAVAAGWAAYRLVDVVCDFLKAKAAGTTNRFDDMLVPLARRTLKIFVVVFCLVFLASKLSENLYSIMAGLGLGSLALGFAAKDSFENLFGTFTVLLDKPFQIGDWVVVNGVEGSVEQVGFRSTRIRTFYNSVVTVPNRDFIASTIDNMGERRYRRIKTTLSLTYDTPPESIEAFCEGVRELIRSHPYMRKDYYHVYLTNLGASSLDVLVYCFVETPEWATEMREKHRLLADILRLAERLKISFAFPTQTIQMQQPADLLHPERPSGDSAGAQWGGREAHSVAEGSLGEFGGVGGAVPPPVNIQSHPQFDAGPKS